MRLTYYLAPKSLGIADGARGNPRVTMRAGRAGGCVAAE